MPQKLSSLELITLALMEQKKAHRKEYLNQRNSGGKKKPNTASITNQNNTQEKMEDSTNE